MPDHLTDTLRAVDAFLRAHDTLLDLITVWAMVISGALLGLANLLCWLILRGTHDKTPVGRWLKRKKAGEGVAWLALATLYALTLLAYYLTLDVGFYPRLLLRLFLFVATVSGTVAALLFVWHLRREDADLRASLGD